MAEAGGAGSPSTWRRAMLAALPASPQPPNPASSTGRRSPPGGSPKTSCIERVYSLGQGGRTFPRLARDNGSQRGERQRAVAEKLVVERAEIETVAEGRLTVAAGGFDFALADLVGQSLAWPDNVAIHFVHRLTLGQADVVEEELDRLLARPAQVVQSGVDDQAARTPGLVAKHAEARQLVGIQPELVGKPLRVQRPALDKGGAQPSGAETSKGW